MREIIVLILFALLLTIASFEAGYIWRDREIDELRKAVYRLEIDSRHLSGRLIGIEATYKAGIRSQRMRSER